MNQCILWIKFSHIRCFFFNAALRHTLWGYCLKYCVFEFDMGLFSSKSWNIIDMDGRMSPALPSTSSSCGSMASMASMVAEGGRRGGGYSWWSHADVQCSRREKIAHVLARWALHVHCQTQWGTMHWYRKNYCQFISKKKTQKKRPLENREQQSCEDKKKLLRWVAEFKKRDSYSSLCFWRGHNLHTWARTYSWKSCFSWAIFF